MRLELLSGCLGLGLSFMISTGCSRPKEAPPPPALGLTAPAPPVVRQHLALGRVAEAREGSTIAIARVATRTLAYVADEDDTAVRVVDLATRQELSVTPLPGRPSQLLVGKDGRLFVAVRDEQSVVVLQPTDDERAPLDQTARIPTAVEPIALAMTPDDTTLLVTSGWGHALEGFAVTSLARTFAVDVAREPRAVMTSSDGRTAYVSHAAAGHLSAIDLGDHSVKTIDLGMSGWSEHRRGRGSRLMLDFSLDGDGLDDAFEPHGFRCGTSMMRTVVQFPARVARQGYALAKLRDERSERVFVPHTAVATGDALVASSGYGGGGLEGIASVPSEMFDIDVIDSAKRTRATGEASRVAVNLRFGPDACRLPRAAVVDEARHALLVSCLGVDTIIEYDASAKTPTGSVMRRFEVPAGPTGIALEPEGRRAVVWSAFDRVVSVIALGEANAVPDGRVKGTKTRVAAKDVPQRPEGAVFTIPVRAARAPLAREVTAGRKLFHAGGDTRIAKDGRACASCHPDGRDDGLVWSTPEGPRQTIFLAGRIGRGAPFGWLGQHPSVKEHIKITMKHLKGAGVADDEYEALASYLAAMKPPPRAPRATLSAEEARGKELFHSSLGCGSCHAETTGFTDLDVHEVGSATVADTRRLFLAPSLRFVGGSAPYFHDGRYATLEELLRKNDRMGDTKALSREDRGALEAYLRTL